MREREQRESCPVCRTYGTPYGTRKYHRAYAESAFFRDQTNTWFTDIKANQDN